MKVFSKLNSEENIINIQKIEQRSINQDLQYDIHDMMSDLDSLSFSKIKSIYDRLDNDSHAISFHQLKELNEESKILFLKKYSDSNSYKQDYSADKDLILDINDLFENSLNNFLNIHDELKANPNMSSNKLHFDDDTLEFEGYLMQKSGNDINIIKRSNPSIVDNFELNSSKSNFNIDLNKFSSLTNELNLHLSNPYADRSEKLESLKYLASNEVHNKKDLPNSKSISISHDDFSFLEKTNTINNKNQKQKSQIKPS